MVLRLRGADANAVRTQQLFLRQARWDDVPILAAHRELVAATLGEGFSLSHAFLDGVAGLGLGYLADVARRGREPGPDVWLLVDAALPRTGTPSDRALAIVDYRPPLACPTPSAVLRVPLPAI